MPADERSRHRLYLKLEEILGPDEARTLMTYLLPTGYANLATKDDLRVLRNEFFGPAGGLEGRIDSIGDRLTEKIEQTERMLIVWTSAMILVTGVLAFVAGRFV
ncbi:MAG: hypothetical protein ACRDHO_04830 [Actinomycetota bacterium]